MVEEIDRTINNLKEITAILDGLKTHGDRLEVIADIIADTGRWSDLILNNLEDVRDTVADFWERQEMPELSRS